MWVMRDFVQGGDKMAKARLILFEVKHPDYGTIKVQAVEEVGAIVAAAGAWGVRWQSYGFYAFCDVFRV